MYFVFGVLNSFGSMFFMYVLLVEVISCEGLESIVDCAFWIDDPTEDISLLYVWLYEIDGYSNCVEFLDEINELVHDSSLDV